MAFNHISADITVDATAYKCPMPLLKLKQALSKISQGQTVLLKSSDIGSVRDIPTYISMTSSKILQQEKSGDSSFIFIVEK